MTQKRSTGLGGITNLAVLAPIKPGMVIGFEPISYLKRLRKVLDGLQSSRQNVRESELRPPFFPDAVGRFGIIHHFRYAIVPPEPEQPTQPENGTWRLSLNVTFDGGWEPYMRVIYRDLGTLLDLLFCHCDGYPGSNARFETYCGWVRRNEVEGGIFYADSPMSLGDQRYLAAVEKAQREKGGKKRGRNGGIDRAIEQIAMPSSAQQYLAALAAAKQDVEHALVLPLRTLKGLYRLSIYFPSGGKPDEMLVLRSFAQSILEGPREVIAPLRVSVKALAADPPAALDPVTLAKAKELAKTFELLEDELNWLETGAGPRKPQTLAKVRKPTELKPEFTLSDVQSHILAGKEQMTHGCIVLLRVRDKKANAAIDHLKRLADRCGPVAAGAIGYVIALTYAGLKALGIAKHHLAALPQEFVDGMEARSALLGDVRGNHPDHWVRPMAEKHNGDLSRVDLNAVHVFMHLRLEDNNPGAQHHALHHLLAAEVEQLRDDRTGLYVMAVQASRSVRSADKPNPGHFDLADGLSQPEIPQGQIALPPAAYNNQVSTGELLLGRANDRGDAANEEIDELLKDGSFLVVRKLRQHVDRLRGALAHLDPAERDDVLAHMLGRRKDGTPLVKLPPRRNGDNDFNYQKADPKALEACPFHAHIRRANPRDPERYVPRIVRRGMSYGPGVDTDPDAERGVFFMAYCASIGEQFEAIQHWIAGGNSTGVGSAQADPFLRVPQAGEPYTLRFLDGDGKVVRVKFDDKPLVQLEWGLYLFVPTVPVLKKLGDLLAGRSEDKKDEPAPEMDELEKVRQRLDDPERARPVWADVRTLGGKAPLKKSAYGELIGSCPEVLAVLKDDGKKFSVAGYGERMAQSIGLNLLGMDGQRHTAEKPFNDAIEAIKEEAAFELAARVVDGILKHIPKLPGYEGDTIERSPIDTVSFSDVVMARLCHIWIGLPDEPAAGDPFMVTGGRLETNGGKPRCPGNFATASRYVFSPHPRPEVEQAGQQQGKAVLKAVEDWLASGQAKLGTLAEDIKEKLGPQASDKAFALGIAGVLLGFPPTVQGNFIRVMENWIEGGALWVHRQTLLEEVAKSGKLDYATANAALRRPLFDTMRERPVPEMLWRSPIEGGQANTRDPARRVVLGLTSALTDKDAPDELIFGRDKEDLPPTVHGCPGYHLAMGVLLAMFAKLMMAGTLRPTGSPVLLILTRCLSGPR